MMTFNIDAWRASGLTSQEQKDLAELLRIYEYHRTKNAKKAKYYEGHVTLGDVNLGLALPEGFAGLEIGCEWGAKTVDVLASRSMFDGFVGADGSEAEAMRRIMVGNHLKSEYGKACRDQLKYGCTFATLSHSDITGAAIRFHSPATASAKWDGEAGRISSGMSILDTVQDESRLGEYTPSIIRYDTAEDVIILRKERRGWSAERHPQKMGQPLMVAFVWNPTSQKPFGQSRLKKPIRELINGYVRTVANATIGLEFSTAPQKYLFGITDEQYDALVNQKFQQYIGNLLMSTVNPETGSAPTFGQLPQGNIEPHVQMIRMLATQYSAATGLSVTDTGVVNDANPSSSDAILAQSQTLVLLAEQLNAANGDSLRLIALMSQAIVRDVTMAELTDEERSVVAHFKNPAMPSVSATTDAALKLATARTGFAQTDVFLEMIGFDQADIRRIKAQERMSAGLQLVADLEE